jgi:hypothetical protein
METNVIEDCVPIGIDSASASLKLFPHQQAAKAAITSAIHPAFRRQPSKKSFI